MVMLHCLIRTYRRPHLLVALARTAAMNFYFILFVLSGACCVRYITHCAFATVHASSNAAIHSVKLVMVSVPSSVWQRSLILTFYSSSCELVCKSSSGGGAICRVVIVSQCEVEEGS